MTVSATDLHENAALFGREAAERHLVHDAPRGDWRFVAVLAATSLEQLAKAALASRNVLLLAETSESSVLALAGAGDTTRIRTIGAAKAIDRYSAFNSRMRPLLARLRGLLDIRNGIVHLAVAKPETFDASFGAYLRAVALLLEDIDEAEEDFWGEELATVVAARRSEHARTIESETQRKIATATARFDAKYRGLSERERAAAVTAAESIRGYLADVTFGHECPACGSTARVDADVEVEWELEELEFVGYLTLSTAALHCGACELVLDGEEVEWGAPDLELPSNLSPYDLSEPPPLDEVPGLRPDDVHPPTVG